MTAGRRQIRAGLVAFVLCVPVFAQTSASEESLRYSVNWPSGLSLGEAQMQSSRSAAGWSLQFSLDAAVPGFTVNDSYHSRTASDFCSEEFLKKFAHGKRKANERVLFDAGRGTITRETTGGGKSETRIPGCSHDALAFLYYLRSELAKGRLPGPQTVYFGAPYQIRFEFGGQQTITVNDHPEAADRVTASLKGPASQTSIELYFSRDAVRTPLLVRVPLPSGPFTLELLR